jgi:uncharacterized protein YbbK (DUF523 family)
MMKSGFFFSLRLSLQKRVLHLVSACLCGIPCRYDGKSSPDKKVQRLVERGKAIPICPEVLGGMSIPRKGAEIIRGGGKQVLDGSARLVTGKGNDVTSFFLQGAFASLVIARKFNAKKVLLKKRSPSCGCGLIKRRGKIVKGEGVAAALLKRNGLKVVPR